MNCLSFFLATVVQKRWFILFLSFYFCYWIFLYLSIVERWLKQFQDFQTIFKESYSLLLILKLLLFIINSFYIGCVHIALYNGHLLFVLFTVLVTSHHSGWPNFGPYYWQCFCLPRGVHQYFNYLALCLKIIEMIVKF